MSTANQLLSRNAEGERQSLLIWRACLTISHVFAILSSIFRLYRRRKTRQIWRDDYFTLAGLLWDCLFFPTLWMPELSSRAGLMATSWMAQITYVPLIWCARISLAFSISRAIPPNQAMRAASVGLVYLFSGLCIGFLVQVCIMCSQNHGNWQHVAPYQCPISESVGIARVLSDILSDILLIILPFCAFWGRLKLPPTTRHLIQACFCASILTTACSVLSAGILFWRTSKYGTEKVETSFIASVMYHLVASVSLIVCNMLVVVTSFYRLFRTEEVVKPIGNLPSPPIPSSAGNSAPTELRSSTTSNVDVEGRTDLPVDQSTLGGPGQDVAANTNSSGATSSSYHLELTELFESDLSHSLTVDVETGQKSEGR